MTQAIDDQALLPKRKAYSYLRFSTPEQRKGDSHRRQTTMAQTYARQHNLDLDETLTFHDEGVSGFRGQNAGAGRLADFLEAVRVGLVPQGSVLLVEQLDRLSRMAPRRAMRVLEDIVDAGVSVVTLNDGREYSPTSIDTDHTDLLISLLTFIRANEESETKSRRLKQTWGNKRATMDARPLTSKAPAWLRLDHAAGRFETIPERAAVVERIFDMTLQGMGQHKIADTLNREGLAPWGRGKHWHKTYIAKILNNPAVIGTITPHVVDHSSGRKQRQPLEPVLAYYPAVISDQTWADVQALHGPRVATSKAGPISNILAGLAVCPKCGATMTRVNKGRPPKGGYAAFVCTRAKVRAGCEYKSVRYQQVESELLKLLPNMINDREGIEQVDELEEQIWVLQKLPPALRSKIQSLLNDLETRNSPAIRERVTVREAELAAVEAQLRDLQERRDAAAGPVVGSRIAKAVAALTPAEGAELDRAEANIALRSLFERVVINWPEGKIDLYWKAGGSCRIQFAPLFEVQKDAGPRGASVYTEGNE